MNYTTSQHEWLKIVANGEPMTAHQERALFLAGRYCASPGLLQYKTRAEAEAALEPIVKEAYRNSLKDDGYGFVVIIWLLIVVAAAAISWAVQRLLDWLYPDSVLDANKERLTELTRLQSRWRAGS